MANPNKVLSRQRTKYDLVMQQVRNTESECIELIKALKQMNYDRITMKRFKTGPRQNIAKGIKQQYSFVIYCYKLKTTT